MSARVRARELTFHEPPRVKVSFPGRGPRRSVQRTRRNIPSPVEPGVTYRRVRAATRIMSALRRKP